MKTVAEFIEKIRTNPNGVEFTETMEVIADNYTYCPSGFDNGGVESEAGTNEGSCKIFAFGKINDLTKEETLKCFGHFYYGVLETPNDNDHANIRQFMKTGWEGISFEKEAWKILS